MMLQGISEEIKNKITLLDKYFKIKHVILIFVAGENDSKKYPTVLNLMEKFGITKKYGHNLLWGLTRDHLLKPHEKMKINGYEYITYELTKKARKELKTICSILNEIRAL